MRIEDEREAFGEIKARFIGEWRKDEKLYHELQKANIGIYDYLTKNALLMKPAILSRNPEIKELFRLLHNDLIFNEPVLYRIFLYNAIEPEDIANRKWLLENHLQHDSLNAVRDVLDGHTSNELLNGFDLRKSFVFEYLQGYIEGYEHYRLIDMVKETGVQESVKELREARIYRTDEGIVFDYSPIFRFIHAGNNRVLEYLNREDYEGQLSRYEQYAHDADSIILSSIEKARTNTDQQSKLVNGFLGTSIAHSQYNLIIRYGALSKHISFQLGHKYRSKIEKEAWEHSSPYLTKEELITTALQGLWRAMTGWDRGKKATATYWLSENIKWKIGSAVRDATNSKNQGLLTYTDEVKDYTPIHSIEPGWIQDTFKKKTETPLDMIVSEERDEAFQQMRHSLTDPTDRRIVEEMLRGKGQNDIADKLGISPSAVNRRLKRIAEQLPKTLVETLTSKE